MAVITKGTLQDYRSDTGEQWRHNNPILPLGTLGHVVGTAEYKRGNGITAWNDLDFVTHEDSRFTPLTPTLYGFNGVTYIENYGQYLQRGDIINLHFKLKVKIDMDQNFGDELNTFVVDLGYDIPKFNNNMLKDVLLGDCKVFGFGDDLNQDVMCQFYIDPYSTFLSIKTKCFTAHQEFVRTLRLGDMQEDILTISGALTYISFDSNDAGMGLELELNDDVLLDTNGNALETRDEYTLYATVDGATENEDSDTDVLLDRESYVLMTRDDMALYVIDPNDTEVDMLSGADMYPISVNVEATGTQTTINRDVSYIACCVQKTLCFLEIYIEFDTPEFDYNKHEWISIEDDEEDENVTVLVDEDENILVTEEDSVVLVIADLNSNPFVPSDDDYALHTEEDEVILDPNGDVALFINEVSGNIFIPAENTTPIMVNIPPNVPMPAGDSNMFLGGDFHSIGFNSLYINHIHIDKVNRKLYFITENNTWEKQLNKLIYDDLSQEVSVLSGSIMYTVE